MDIKLNCKVIKVMPKIIIVVHIQHETEKSDKIKIPKEHESIIVTCHITRLIIYNSWKAETWNNWFWCCKKNLCISILLHHLNLYLI